MCSCVRVCVFEYVLVCGHVFRLCVRASVYVCVRVRASVWYVSYTITSKLLFYCRRKTGHRKKNFIFLYFYCSNLFHLLVQEARKQKPTVYRLLQS